MNRLAAILLATSAIAAATQVSADVYEGGKDKPFYWSDAKPQGGPLLEKAPAPTPAPAAAPAPAPMGTAPLMSGDCYPAEDMPNTDLISLGETEDGDASPNSGRLQRRGEMTGDDGVLEAIQETPCVHISRRGGETAESLRQYTHPNDIRRVNTLEDRRIPVHEVGRYAAEGSALWHQDVRAPYSDVARSWSVAKGTMLSEILIAWGEQAGFNVDWRSPHDYVIRADVTIQGTFPEAAGKVIESFADADPPIDAELFMENRALVVTSGTTFDRR